jgi:hypothetical protein
MATNGTSNGINVSGWKHYNEGTFLFTVSSAPTRLRGYRSLDRAELTATPMTFSPSP